MRRLIYAPRAYVFIRSENMNGRIYDVSGDLVSGTITRNVNDLSKAEITLRNRFFKWITDPKSKRQLFLPMDLITIWLQRVAGKPIQVFTGYLDSVPYYQMYPGNCIIRASCTLKKLAYSWFDPGLNFFHNWVRNIQGWQIDPTTGEAWDTTLNAPGGLGGTPTPSVIFCLGGFGSACERGQRRFLANTDPGGRARDTCLHALHGLPNELFRRDLHGRWRFVLDLLTTTDVHACSA